MGRPRLKDGPKPQISTHVSRDLMKRIAALMKKERRTVLSNTAALLLETALDVQDQLHVDLAKVLPTLERLIKERAGAGEHEGVPAKRRADIK